MGKKEAQRKTLYPKLINLLARGYSQTEIARRLNLSQSKVSRDIRNIRKMVSQGEIRINVRVDM